VGETIQSGADVVTFSGDKLLGGPQAGIIAGKKDALDRIKKNPLTRALRIDKLTLAALEPTLKLYRDEERAIRTIPTLNMLTMSFVNVCSKAELLFNEIQNALGSKVQLEFADLNSRPGGGSFPELDLPTRCVSLKPLNISVTKLETAMRLSTPAIIGRIVDDCYIMDPRTILVGQEAIIASTLVNIVK
jgi:L-seryl-tRNA(Ser) seleniumtransferase